MRKDSTGAWPSHIWNPILRRMLEWTGRQQHVQYARAFQKLLEWGGEERNLLRL